ncbi:MAG: hypothetical protein L0331_31780 [Chloroflexi bacterium]|nr:hypothetical protein [Chloroflexota bacterium]
MTASIYQNAQLVQIAPAGEWYVAFPHPEQPGALVVDTGKNLTFAAEYAPETLTAFRPVPTLNRFINLRLEFVPSMIELSTFDLLANILSQAMSDIQQREVDRRHRLMFLTLLDLYAALGQGLHQALTTVPAREETLYIENDFIAQGLQVRLALIGEETRR